MVWSAWIGKGLVLLLAGIMAGCPQERAPEDGDRASATVRDGEPIELAGGGPFRVIGNLGTGLTPGATVMSWSGRPVTVALPGFPVLLVNDQPVTGEEGRWLPPRGTGERQHLRFLGGRLHADFEHWFRDVFRRDSEVRVVDDFAIRLGRKPALAMTWWLAESPELEVVLADEAAGRWRWRWSGVELEIQATKGTRAEWVSGAGGLTRLTLTGPSGSATWKLLQIFREAPPRTGGAG